MNHVTKFLILIPFLLSFICQNGDHTHIPPKPPEPDQIVNGLYFGVVGFNATTQEKPISNNITQTKSFIDELNNDSDQTALAYGMIRAVDMLKASVTSEELDVVFDKLFIVTFTDGNDNYSSIYFQVPQSQVTQYVESYLNDPLNQISGNYISSYTIGLEDTVGQLNTNDLTTLAVRGEYTSSTSITLNTTFSNIADSIIDSAINFYIVTSNGYYPITSPKLLNVLITYLDSSGLLFEPTTSIYGEFYKDLDNGFFVAQSFNTLLVSFSGNDFTPVNATLEGTKYIIPLDNLKITNNGTEEQIIDVEVQLKYDPALPWFTDVEDSKIIQSISKNIGVILVLDCSSSLGNNFSSMKVAAKDLIDRMIQSKQDFE